MCPRTNLEKDSTEGGVLSGSAVTKQSLNTNQNSAESGVAPAPGGRGGGGGWGGGWGTGATSTSAMGKVLV